jgi:2-methylisocitrate lyase-like PEP mutase family enzyme
MPNAWDIGSAKLFAAMDFKAIATTSGGFAATRGRLDGAMSKQEVFVHTQELATAVDIPVSADLENGFAHDPEGVADTIAAAIASGLAGGSVEDFSGNADDPIYELAHAADRVRAAAEAAHRGPVHLVLTARAENFLHGRPDLADTIKRMQAYQEAGADVLFAPRVDSREELKQLMKSVDIPVSVLMTPDAPNVGVLAELGVSRISVGGAIAVAAYGAAMRAVAELRDEGTAGYWELTQSARSTIQAAFSR